MITISPPLKAAIMEGTFCTLVRITADLGQVFGYTDYPVPLTYDGTIFEPAPSLARLRNFQTSSTASNSQKVEIVRLGDFTEEELQSGIFDNAIVEVMRVVPSRLDLGHFLISRENIAATKWDENSLNFDVLDIFRGLNTTIGTENSPYCRHQFGDQISPAKKGACKLNAAAFTYNFTVATVQKSKMVFTINSSLAANWLSNGALTWVFGNNASGETSIKSHEIINGVHTITLFVPTTFAIQPGDTFKVVVGCDGTFQTCNSKFNNGRNFGGNPILNPGVTQR